MSPTNNEASANVPPETKPYKLILKSNDNIEFTVDDKLAKMSQTIKNMLESLGDVDKETEVPVPLNVEGDQLAKIIEWAEKHKDDYSASSLEEDKRKYDPHAFDREQEIKIDEWDSAYFGKLSLVDIYKILMSSNYLDIKPLIESVCKYIALQIKDKSSKEIVDLFAPVKEYNTSVATGTRS